LAAEKSWFDSRQRQEIFLRTILYYKKGKAVNAVAGLEWPRGFQEVKVPRFHDNGTGWW
jgi:hypothetical protein